jgi:hypothetical protein
MIPLDYALAVVLLTSSPDSAETPPAVDEFLSVRPTTQSLALTWEILDRREVKYVLSRPEDFASDLRLLRKRWEELADAPPLHDGVRFPDRTLVNDLLSFNRAYRQNLEAQQNLDRDHFWELREVVQEVDHLYQVWDLVRDARCEYFYVTVRRQALKKLRETLGDEAYYSASMPPHVPVWRFARAD